jgi:hypothetical protein
MNERSGIVGHAKVFFPTSEMDQGEYLGAEAEADVKAWGVNVGCSSAGRKRWGR